MSLDVYLTVAGLRQPSNGSGIFIRENGQTKQITRAEWDAKFPDREPVLVLTDTDIDEEGDTHEVYSTNITHNLNTMAGKAGIYQHLWRPDEVGIDRAGQLIEPLRAGLELLRSDPERFKVFNPENGWGDYDGLVAFVAEYIGACERWPDAAVGVSR